MSILNTSVSGMQANSNWLSTISQNVANSNTTGYKSRDGVLDDGRSGVNGLPDLAGSPRASLAECASGQYRLHLNIDQSRRPGLGYFVVSDASGALYLTRNGSFSPDASGNLVNSAGYYLMGEDVLEAFRPFAANSLSGLSKSMSSMPVKRRPPRPPVRSPRICLPPRPVPPQNCRRQLRDSTTEATSLVVYDNLGGAHTINLYFTKTGANTWEVDAYDSSGASANGGFPYSSGPLATEP